MMNTIRFNEQQVQMTNEQTFAMHTVARNNQVDYIRNKAFRGSGPKVY